MNKRLRGEKGLSEAVFIKISNKKRNKLRLNNDLLRLVGK